MNGRERIHEFIRDQERYATGSHMARTRQRYWDLAADMQLMLDVCNAAAESLAKAGTHGSNQRLAKSLERLDAEAAREQGVY